MRIKHLVNNSFDNRFNISFLMSIIAFEEFIMNKLKLFVIIFLLPYFSFSQSEVKAGEVQGLHAKKKEPYKNSY